MELDSHSHLEFLDCFYSATLALSFGQSPNSKSALIRTLLSVKPDGRTPATQKYSSNTLKLREY